MDDYAAVAALADPLRRRLYRYVVAQADAVGREQAAEGAGVPLHTARFHLEKLVDEGLLETEYRRLSGRAGPGAGRPAKLYRRTATEVSVQLPERSYDLIGSVLAGAVARSLAGEPLESALTREARDRGHTSGVAYEAERERPGAHRRPAGRRGLRAERRRRHPLDAQLSVRRARSRAARARVRGLPRLRGGCPRGSRVSPARGAARTGSRPVLRQGREELAATGVLAGWRHEAGTAAGVLGRTAAGRCRRAGRGRRGRRLRRPVRRRGVGERRVHAAGVVGARDQAAAARDVDRADVRTHADVDRDARADARPPLSGPGDPGHGCLRAAGGRGLVRAAVLEAAGAHPRGGRHRAPGARAGGAGHQRRPALPVAVRR